MHRLFNRVALVTGAARGIGAAIARAFIVEGAIVHLTDINDTAGTALAAELGPNAIYQRLDVRDEADWQAVTDRLLENQGRLDIMVNNAGISGFEDGLIAQDPEHASLESWHAVHQTNLDGVFLGCKYAIRTMRKQGCGSIINISSRSGIVGIPNAAAYASSKAAVRNHTKSVALYCAEQGLNIRCNSIHPAAILTPMLESLLGTGPDRDARLQRVLQGCPLQRFGTPDEVAAVAVFLASDEVRYMTGAELIVDGGILAGSSAVPDKNAT